MAKTKRRTGRKTGFVAAFAKARARDAHPHLGPINAASFAADRGVAVAKAANLFAYQKYLAAARADKARRKRVPESFERNVLAQARQARDDLDAFTGAGLRMIQQVNQTGLWGRTQAQFARTLRDRGPVDVRTMWAEIAGNAQYRTALAGHGISADMTAAMTEAFATLDATAVLRNGKVAVETRVAGERAPRRMALGAGASPPAGLSDLLRRSQFDRVAAAFANKEPVHLEIVPAAGLTAYEPADLFALGAVAVRQRMTEHVRKLEDTGLAIYEGNDPFSFTLALLVIGLFLGLVGSVIQHLCDNPTEVEQPEWLCTVGAALLIIALILLAAVFIIGFLEGAAFSIVAWIGLMLMAQYIADAYAHFTSFNVEGVPSS